MNEAVKEEIRALINANPFDAAKGAQLFFAHSKFGIKQRQFLSNPKYYADKIKWELCKLIGVTLNEFHALNGNAVVKPAKAIVPITNKAGAPAYPSIIDRIKDELKVIYAQRTEAQKKITMLGDANDDETKQQAIKLGETIDELADRHQQLHDSKELFFKDGTLPNEAELFPEAVSKPEKTTKEAAPKFDFEAKGDIWVMNRKTNLISSLTKDKNQLKYQNKAAQPTENPMPKGDKRTEIEQRIAAKETELKAIEAYLNTKNNAR